MSVLGLWQVLYCRRQGWRGNSNALACFGSSIITLLWLLGRKSASRRCLPSRRSSTRYAYRSTRKCLEMAGREMGKAPAMRPADWLPWRRRPSTAGRVGSASALKAAPPEFVTNGDASFAPIRLHKGHVKKSLRNSWLTAGGRSCLSPGDGGKGNSSWGAV